MPAEAGPGRGFDAFTCEELEVQGRRFAIRRAVESDLPALITLLADDVVGAVREGGASDVDAYARAFALIAEDPNQLLIAVAEVGEGTGHDAGGAPTGTSAGTASDSAAGRVAGSAEGRVVGTLQLSLVPSLSRSGTVRLQIEAVRIGAGAQGIGLGTAVFEWAHDCGRRFGATLAQLTTDKSRTDAQRFYARLGYVASHEGLKLPLV